MSERERDGESERLPFWEKLESGLSLGRAWRVRRSLASLSGRPVAWCCCDHRPGLYWRESLHCSFIRDMAPPLRVDTEVPVKFGTRATSEQEYKILQAFLARALCAFTFACIYGR